MRTSPFVAALLVVTAACAPNDSKSPDQKADPHTVTITASDFALQAPDTIQSGMTTLVLKNAGSTIHHAAFVRLKDNKTMADLATAMKNMKPGEAPPTWMEEAGGAQIPDPGTQTSAILDIPAGNYVMLCFVDTPDKVPHFAKGMMHAFTVIPATAPAAAEPTADITVTLSDYTFAFSTPLTAGHHVLKIVDGAKQHHELVLMKLKAGKTIEDVGAWGKDYKGEMPAVAMGGVPAIVSGQAEYVPVDLTPGNYVVMCFLSDEKDGKAHMEHGMVMPITVK